MPSWLLDSLPPLAHHPLRECWLIVGAYPLDAADAALQRLLHWLCVRVLVARDAEAARLGPRRATVGVVSGSAAFHDNDDVMMLSLPILVMGGAANELGLTSSWTEVDGCGAAELLPATPGRDTLLLSGVRSYLPLYEHPARVFAGSPCGKDVRVLARPSFMAAERAAEAVLFVHTSGDTLCDQRRRRAPAPRVVFGLAREAWGPREYSRASVQTANLTVSILLSLGAADRATHEGVLRTLNDVAEGVAASEETELEWRAYATARQTLAQLTQTHSPSATPVHGSIQGDLECVNRAPSSPLFTSTSGMAHTGTGIGTGAGAVDGSPSPGSGPNPDPSTTVMLHTCDAYARFWPGWARFFAQSWNASLGWPLVFANEQSLRAAETIAPLRKCGISARLAPTGFGEFSTRLRNALLALATPLLFYMQEDAWLLPIASEAMGSVLSCAEGLLLSGRFDGIRFESAASLRAGLYHVEAASVGDHADVDDGRIGSGPRTLECGGHTVYRFVARHNRWLYSHQPGLWRRDALLGATAAERNAAVVQPGENPWLNELLGSRRAQKLGLVVGLIVVEWYRAVSSGGSLNAHGTAMLAPGTAGL